MTEQTTTDQIGSDGTPELSGVDLARVALQQARLAAKNNGGEARAPRRRRATTVKRDGREPAGFAAVLARLMADRAWELPAAGGSVLDQWPDIAAAVAPQLPHHVTAVAFRPETGQLDLRPDSSSYATQIRLITARIVAAANEAAGTDAVRTVRVLPPGAVPGPRTAPAVAPAAPQTPVKTREMGSPGFQQALAAHQAVVPPSRVDLSIAEAVERQTRAMRTLSLQAFLEPEQAADEQPAPIEQARSERRRQAEVSHAAALRRARAERAAREAGTAAAVPHPTLLGRTA
ncbi:DciA family protein [Streptomyces sp. NRRL WC-3744]|uniref:DciA family protein n=1 Tax=Streptomyces sp. NRRL WC-3744 TaxID=1463935 RepID=UPI0004CBDC59|nr:DciA family protein [Streptomyces sp. NRRL WC-3744]